MEKKDKIKVKVVYDFMKKLQKPIKQIVELYPGVTAKIEYYILFNNGWDVDILSENIKVSKEIQKILNIFVVEAENGSGEDYSDLIDLDEYQKQFELLATKAGIDDDDYHWFNDNAMGLNWTDWWEEFSSEFDDSTKIKYQKISLNGSYHAIIDKKKQSVQVGCQRIPIDAVRKLIAEYDKTN